MLVVLEACRQFLIRHFCLVRDKQLSGSPVKWCLTRKDVWSYCVFLNSFMRQKLHTLIFIEAWWTFTETKRWMWAQLSSEYYCSSTGPIAMYVTSYILNAAYWFVFAVAIDNNCENIVFCSWKIVLIQRAVDYLYSLQFPLEKRVITFRVYPISYTYIYIIMNSCIFYFLSDITSYYLNGIF